MNIQQLKNFDADRMDIEELVALHADAVVLQAQFQNLSIEEPDWLTLGVKKIHREIRARVQDQFEKRAKEIRVRIDALKTPSERKKELQAELQKVEAQLQS